MSPIFVSFHTPGPYEREARGLVASLDALGLAHDVRQVPCCGSWTANCARKSTFVRDMMVAYPLSPLVWLDADARVLRRPDLFEELADSGMDLACHWLRRPGREPELLSGTLFFGATEGAARIVGRWCQKCLDQPEVWDQRSLASVLNEPELACLKITVLPESFCYIFDRNTLPPEHVFVEHGQASRRLKHCVA
jgi:hypothetical protein